MKIGEIWTPKLKDSYEEDDLLHGDVEILKLEEDMTIKFIETEFICRTDIASFLKTYKKVYK